MDGERFNELLQSAIREWHGTSIDGDPQAFDQLLTGDETREFKGRIESQTIHNFSTRPWSTPAPKLAATLETLAGKSAGNEGLSWINKLTTLLTADESQALQHYQCKPHEELTPELTVLALCCAIRLGSLDLVDEILKQHPFRESLACQSIAELCLGMAIRLRNQELFLLLGRHGAGLCPYLAEGICRLSSFEKFSEGFCREALSVCGIRDRGGEWMDTLAVLLPHIDNNDLEAYLPQAREFRYTEDTPGRHFLPAYCVTDPARLEYLLEHGLDIQTYAESQNFHGLLRNPLGWLLFYTCGMLQVEYDRGNIAKLLEIMLRNGIDLRQLAAEEDIDGKPYNAFMDLMFAIARLEDLTYRQIEQRFRQMLEVFRYLHGLGIDVAGTNSHGNNILHFMVEQRELPDELILEYVKLGISPWQRDADGDTPYSIARKRYFPNLAKAMLELWPMPDDYSEEPRGRNEVERASRKQSSADLYELLNDPQKLAQLSDRDLHRSACIAIIRNKPSHLSMLLQAGAADFKLDPDEMDPLRLSDPEQHFMGLHHEHSGEHSYSLLAIALACCNEACVAMLLKHGADPNEGLIRDDEIGCWTGTPPLAFLGVWEKQYTVVDNELMECAYLMHAAGARFNFILNNRAARQYTELRPMLQFWVELYSVGEVEQLIRLGADPAQAEIANPGGVHSLYKRWRYMRGLCWHARNSTELVALLAAAASREELIGALPACLHEDSADKLAALLDNLDPELDDDSQRNLQRMAIMDLAADCLGLPRERGWNPDLPNGGLDELISAVLCGDTDIRLPLTVGNKVG
jgi:hypothetical protein